MLDIFTCIIISIVTSFSLLIMAIGSSHRLKKVAFPKDRNLKIVLPKSPKDLRGNQPVWVHRAFQNMPKINGIEYVDLVNPQHFAKNSSEANLVSEIDENPKIIPKETSV